MLKSIGLSLIVCLGLLTACNKEGQLETIKETEYEYFGGL
jgi:hypothetical protein